MPNIELGKSLHIAVIGGSLAGLFVAIPLVRLGHRVTILERSPVPLLHDQGAGVVAGSETLKWVETFGRRKKDKTGGDDDVDERGRAMKAEDFSVSSRERLYLDQVGNVIDREEREQRMTSWGVLYRLGRIGFDGLRVGSDKAGMLGVSADASDAKTRMEARYEYGRTVERVEDRGEKVEVFYRQTRTDGNAEDGSLQADFVIAADGPSSNMRRLLLGEDKAAQRKYAGYVAFRGTVPENELSSAAKDVFVEKFTFFHGKDPNTQILAYTIPDSDGVLERGRRLVNWVWYWNYELESEEYKDLMTDTKGNSHRFTLPTGGHMQPQVWLRQQEIAKKHLPPQFAEVIEKTEKPFVQAITDVEPPPEDTRFTQFLGGKAMIAGDALAGFRPHTAASTSQAALHALLLNEVFQGKMGWNDYERAALDYAQELQRRGVMLGQRSQFGRHPLTG